LSTILKQAPPELTSAFDGLGLGSYCLNREGHFTYMNPAGAELLGWRPEELLGEHAHDLIGSALFEVTQPRVTYWRLGIPGSGACGAATWRRRRCTTRATR
jgi:PAS domain-containing protein